LTFGANIPPLTPPANIALLAGALSGTFKSKTALSKCR
jgi:hypothetical protein